MVVIQNEWGFSPAISDFTPNIIIWQSKVVLPDSLAIKMYVQPLE